jgi:cellulose synthase/poly-beta-1,6-N-acetylglucosamine synthase-like glycosyltransferase
MRWRLRVALTAAGAIGAVVLLVLVILPARLESVALWIGCVLAVFIGAMPVFASIMQYLLATVHGLRRRYARLRGYYPNTAIVVPARNEGTVIGATIDHLLAMEYPPESIRVVVVDDASTDNTADVVRAKAAEYQARVVYLRREHGGLGKAHALNHGIEFVLSDSWAQAVLLSDADVLFEPDTLRKLTRHLSDPDVGAVAAYIKELRADTYLARFIAFEYVIAQAIGRRAQNIVGALAYVAAGAQLYSRAGLEAIGGRIDTSTLAEDAVTTFEIQLARRRVEFEGNAVAWEEAPTDLESLWRQRLRWARGSLQVSLQYASIWGRQRARFGRLARPTFLLLWYSGLLLPLLMFGSSIGLVVLYVSNDAWAWTAFRVLWIWYGIAYLFGTALGLSFDPRAAKRSWLQALAYPGLVAVAIMAYAIAPQAIDAGLEWLAGRAGRVSVWGAGLRPVVTLFAYSWLLLCVPLAYLARPASRTSRFRWVSPLMIYLAGYGPFLCAAQTASYVKELSNATPASDKTQKTRSVTVGAMPSRATSTR